MKCPRIAVAAMKVANERTSHLIRFIGFHLIDECLVSADFVAKSGLVAMDVGLRDGGFAFQNGFPQCA
jgi:hypothetical protein